MSAVKKKTKEKEMKKRRFSLIQVSEGVKSRFFFVKEIAR